MELEHREEQSEKKGLWAKIRRWPRRLKWTVAVVLLLSTVSAAMARVNDPSVAVKTAELKREDIKRTVLASGRLEAVDEQEFFTPVDSTLMELGVAVGDRVKKGQFLGRLDTLELKRLYEEARARLADKQAALAEAGVTSDALALKEARAAYDKAKNHWERIEFLYGRGAVTEEELESARVDFAGAEVKYREAKKRVETGIAAKKKASLQAQVNLAAQEVAQAKERLELATFTATGPGVVLFVGADKGNRVQEGTRLLVVGNDEELEVTTDINEIDAGSLQVGQPVTITCATLPGKEFNGEVSRVASAAVTRASGGDNVVSVPVTISINGDTGGLKLGYTVELSVTTRQEENVLTLPFEAIVKGEKEEVVYVVEKGTAKRREVQTRPGNEIYDIVVSGLQEGDRVIVNPSPVLKDGMEVTEISPGEGK